MPQPRKRIRISSFVLTLLLAVGVTPVEAQERFEDRLAALERRVANLEDLLMHALSSSESPGIDDLAEEIAGSMMSVSLRAKGVIQEDFPAHLGFDFEFTSHLEKPVRAFKGIVVFQDLFGQEIMRLDVTVEDPVTRGRTVRWQDSTAFIVGDPPRIVTIDEDDLVTTFLLEEVVYQDGTRQQFRRP